MPNRAIVGKNKKKIQSLGTGVILREKHLENKVVNLGEKNSQIDERKLEYSLRL